MEARERERKQEEIFATEELCFNINPRLILKLLTVKNGLQLLQNKREADAGARNNDPTFL